MGLPLVDLVAQYSSIKHEVDAAIQGIVARGAFIGGEAVRAFEAEFAAWCGTGKQALHCASCANGTDALYLTLRALGIGPGDEVITVAHTFIATAEAITLSGARPVFVDVRDDTLLMDPDAAEAAVTPRTRAIIPVHLYGQSCPMDRLLGIARRHGLKVVEDAAQAHGARWQGQRVGGFGDAACFSFYPGKNLGAYGDGGAVVSRDADLIRRVRRLADHGSLEKYTHEIVGVNSRLDALQAAVLRVKLRHLDGWNAARHRHAARFLACLDPSRIRLPVVRPPAESVWHLFVVRVRERARVQASLAERGIATGIHYPVPLHRQPAYAHLGISERALPVAETAAAEVLSLPLYPELTDAQIKVITSAVNAATVSPAGEHGYGPAKG
jgi:dTDP-4-amino-4,6-dideoxygalactose transaminase